MRNDSRATLELWGGVECTVNRVGDEYFEQLGQSGHESRISDLDLFSDLGITSLRQPVLWERVAPEGLENADWSWSDQWLARLRDLKINPIVGLLHHGSGPRTTNLLAEDFPERFAKYAAAVARRYPWIRDFTPVNEPLTTARFSALYGLWYPHKRDELSFLQALINECRATVLAMTAIREVNPEARLVQTEDLGKIFATPRLRYQADFENERRWLGFDLLCGKVSPDHPLWTRMISAGISRHQLEWFSDRPVPPDVLGFNYYLSSERYLDEHLAQYPPHLHGGNGRDRYVDVEAARIRLNGISGAGQLLTEAWDRYGIAVAITECHNGCTREEQLRWFAEVWEDCERIKQHGVDVRAVTAWSLLGAFDWNTLVTRRTGHYEPGVFDVRSPSPRPTAIAKLARSLALGQEITHPALDAQGWWHRPSRFIHQRALSDGDKHLGPTRVLTMTRAQQRNPRPLLITGGTGTLGRAFEHACVARGLAYKLTLRSEMDIAEPSAVAAIFDVIEPWAVINTAGYVRVDDAENDGERCMRENARGAVVLATECARRGIQFVTFSSDLVFNGEKDSPYTENDRTDPLNVYGFSKLLAETGVLHQLPNALIIRTSAFFGPWDNYNFVTAALRDLSAGRKFIAAADAIVSPTYVPDLVHQTLDLMIDGETGIWHLANAGAMTWYELAKRAAELQGISTTTLIPCSTNDLRLPAPRPVYSALASERAWIMPTLSNALERYMRECTAFAELDSKAA